MPSPQSTQQRLLVAAIGDAPAAAPARTTPPGPRPARGRRCLRAQLIRAGAVAVSLCVLVMLRPGTAAYRKLTRLPGQNDNLKRFLPPSRRRAARQLRNRLEKRATPTRADAAIDPDWAWFAPDSPFRRCGVGGRPHAPSNTGSTWCQDLDVEASV